VIEQRENGFGSRWEKVDNSTLWESWYDSRQTIDIFLRRYCTKDFCFIFYIKKSSKIWLSFFLNKIML
jgi:hypothetical protein